MKITVKDVLTLLRTTDDIKIAWNGVLVDFDPQSGLDVDAYGDYVVEGIRANGENAIEVDLLMRPVKVSRLKVAHSIHNIHK